MNLINDALAEIFPEPEKCLRRKQQVSGVPGPDALGREIWKRHLANLAAFKDLAAANGAKLLVVLIPTNTQVYPFLAAHQGLDLERPNRMLGSFLKAQGIDYLDLLPLMRSYADEQPRPSLNPDRDLYWQHNSHWSIRGEHLAGLLVSRYILEHRLVQVPDREEKLREIEEKLRKFR